MEKNKNRRKNKYNSENYRPEKGIDSYRSETEDNRFMKKYARFDPTKTSSADSDYNAVGNLAIHMNEGRI
jgi:hypothetical protein